MYAPSLLLVGIGNVWGADATLTFSAQGYENAQNVSSGTIDSYTTWSATKGTTSEPAYYTIGAGLRVYNGGTFSVTSSKIIASITLTFSDKDYTFSTSNTTNPQTVTPNAASYSWNVSRTCRLQKVEVTYASGGSIPANYTVTVANNIANGTVTATPTSAAEGETVTLTATPAKGYEFGSWNVTNASSSAAITVTDNKFTMPAAHVNVSATFNQVQGGVTYNFADMTNFSTWTTGYEKRTTTFSDGAYVELASANKSTSTIKDCPVTKGGDVIFKAPEGKKISSLTFTCTQWTTKAQTITLNTSSNGTDYTATSTTSSNFVLSASNLTDVTAVKFTFSSSGNQVGIKSIMVTYADDDEDPDPEKELIAIQASGTPAEFWKGDAFNHDGITVTALWDDEDEEDVTSSCEFSGYDMSTAGQQTVTVTFKGETCQYGIEVKTIANTQETAYTVAEAKALIDAGKDLATQVYVKGTVSEIVTAWSDQYNNITYAISDDGQTTGTQFQLFRCVTNGAAVGDDVVAYGTLTKYNEIYEFAAGNTIVGIQKPAQKTITALEVSGTPTKTTYNVGDAFETAGLTVTATYSDETTATITSGFEWEIDYGTGNDALVAGVTSVDVMAYIGDDVMSEVYTVNGLTVTVPVTLTSIAVSGTPTKTAYYAGDAFETAGLVVTGTYSDSHQETITEGIEWTIDPETLALGATSVDVLAGVGSVVSEVYTVEGLTVTKAPFETVTYTFSEFTSGQTVELTDLDGFVITLAKGSGGSNPSWVVSASEARLYATGSMTVKANNATIKSIEYDYTVNANKNDVTPTIDGVEGKTYAGTWDEESKTWTGADEEVTFSTSGTAGNIGFTKLIIKYVEATKIETSLAWSAAEATATIGADDNVFPTLATNPVDLAGVTYESSNTDVATIAVDGTITLKKAGETTITAKYKGDAEHAASTPASYTLTVSKAPFVPKPAEDGYETVDFAALYSSVTNNATVEDYEGTSFAMAFAKPESSSTPTKYYDNGKAVRAYEGNTITINAAEPITSVVMNWTVVDDGVSITGLGTTTAVVTFSKTCRFTAISVDYRSATISIASVCKDGEKCYSTYSNATSWVVPAELTVSEIGVSEGKLNVVSYETGDVVPANTGVMVSAAEGGNYTVALTTNDGSHPADVTNCLRPSGNAGISATDMAAADENCTYYRLTMHNGTQIGFWWGAENGAAFNLAANKAYLAVPNDAMVKANGMWFGNTETAIENLMSEKSNSVIYNVAGQRVSKATKGLYIKDGRKFIVK